MSSNEIDEPVVNIGDRLKLYWPKDDLETEKLEGEVVNVERSNKKKHGSSFKYTIRISECDVRESRLNIKWKLKKRKRNAISNDEIRCSSQLNSPEQIRQHCNRKYGATLAYTPMINSERFAVDDDYRKEQFQSTPEDRPLVAHFSGNNPDTLLQAARHVEKLCDAIDLNLGCPQRVAHAGHFGSYLLDESDRALVLSIVSKLASNLSIPVFVKIRLLDTVAETTTLCRQLIAAGAALLAIHGRYRVNLVGRTGAGARDGAAHLDQIKTIITELASDPATQGVPIIANGNVVTWRDVVNNQEFTQASGIMTAEGILDNPAIFHPAATLTQSTSSATSGMATSPSNLRLALEYLTLVALHPVKMKSVVFHVRRMCRDELTRYQLLDDVVVRSANVADVLSHVQKALRYEESGGFVFDAHKEKTAKEALERRKREEGKRKAYEERMVRKAKREGLADLQFYARQGTELPTIEELQELKALGKDVSFAEWGKRHKQHCYAYHFDPTGCARERTCSFIHADVSYGETVAYG